MDLVDAIQTIAALATTVGIVFAAFSLNESRKQRVAEFEIHMNQRYQRIQAGIPLALLTGEAPFDPSDEAVERALYDYFELCEEERFYAERHKVSRSTWVEEWSKGIALNLEKPAFQEALVHFRDVRGREFPWLIKDFPPRNEGTSPTV